MNKYYPGIRVLILLMISCLIAGPVVANSSTADELFKQAEQKYLQFQTEQAVDLLHRALKKQPDHKPSRDLLDEMGREVPSMESLRTTPDTSDEESERTPSDQEPGDEEPADTSIQPPSTADTDVTQSDTSSDKSSDTTSPTDSAETSDKTAQQDDTGVPRPDNLSKPDTGSTDESPDESRTTTDNVETTDTESTETEEETRPIIVPETPTDPTEAAPAPPVVPSSGSTTDSADTVGIQPDDPLIYPELNIDTTQRTAPDQGQSNASGKNGPDLQPVLRSSSEQSDTRNQPSGRSDQSASQNYQPNLNTSNDVELSDQVNDRLVERIITERNENGFYLNWTDFRDRLNPGAERFRRIREHFTLAIPVLDINSVTAEELSRLPYLSRDIANNIANFRFTYGSFSSVEQLIEVPGIEESSLERVAPYLEAR